MGDALRVSQVDMDNLTNTNRKSRQEAITNVFESVKSASASVRTFASSLSISLPLDPVVWKHETSVLDFCRLFYTLFPHIFPRMNDAAEKIRYVALQTLLIFMDTIDLSRAELDNQSVLSLLIDYTCHRLGLPHSSAPAPLFISACSGGPGLVATGCEGSEEVRGEIMDVMLRVCAGDVTSSVSSLLPLLKTTLADTCPAIQRAACALIAVVMGSHTFPDPEKHLPKKTPEFSENSEFEVVPGLRFSGVHASLWTGVLAHIHLSTASASASAASSLPSSLLCRVPIQPAAIATFTDGILRALTPLLSHAHAKTRISALTALTALLLPPSSLSTTTNTTTTTSISFAALFPLAPTSPSLLLPLPSSLPPLLAIVAALTNDHNITVANAAMAAAAAIAAGYIVSNTRVGAQTDCIHKQHSGKHGNHDKDTHTSLASDITASTDAVPHATSTSSPSMPAALSPLDPDMATLLLSLLAHTLHTTLSSTAFPLLTHLSLVTVNALIEKGVCVCCMLPDAHPYAHTPLYTPTDTNTSTADNTNPSLSASSLPTSTLTVVPLAVPAPLASPLPTHVPLPVALLLPAIVRPLVTALTPRLTHWQAPPRLSSLRALHALLALCPTLDSDLLDMGPTQHPTTLNSDRNVLASDRALSIGASQGNDPSLHGVSPLLSGLSKALVDVDTEVVKEAVCTVPLLAMRLPTAVPHALALVHTHLHAFAEAVGTPALRPHTFPHAPKHTAPTSTSTSTPTSSSSSSSGSPTPTSTGPRSLASSLWLLAHLLLGAEVAWWNMMALPWHARRVARDGISVDGKDAITDVKEGDFTTNTATATATPSAASYLPVPLASPPALSPLLSPPLSLASLARIPLPLPSLAPSSSSSPTPSASSSALVYAHPISSASLLSLLALLASPTFATSAATTLAPPLLSLLTLATRALATYTNMHVSLPGATSASSSPLPLAPSPWPLAVDARYVQLSYPVPPPALAPPTASSTSSPSSTSLPIQHSTGLLLLHCARSSSLSPSFQVQTAAQAQAPATLLPSLYALLLAFTALGQPNPAAPVYSMSTHNPNKNDITNDSTDSGGGSACRSGDHEAADSLWSTDTNTSASASTWVLCPSPIAWPIAATALACLYQLCSPATLRGVCDALHSDRKETLHSDADMQDSDDEAVNAADMIDNNDLATQTQPLSVASSSALASSLPYTSPNALLTTSPLPSPFKAFTQLSLCFLAPLLSLLLSASSLPLPAPSSLTLALSLFPRPDVVEFGSCSSEAIDKRQQVLAKVLVMAHHDRAHPPIPTLSTLPSSEVDLSGQDTVFADPYPDSSASFASGLSPGFTASASAILTHVLSAAPLAALRALTHTHAHDMDTDADVHIDTQGTQGVTTCTDVGPIASSLATTASASASASAFALLLRRLHPSLPPLAHAPVLASLSLSLAALAPFTTPLSWTQTTTTTTTHAHVHAQVHMKEQARVCAEAWSQVPWHDMTQLLMALLALCVWSPGSVAESTRTHALSLMLLLLACPAPSTLSPCPSASSSTSTTCTSSLLAHPHALPHTSLMLLPHLPPAFTHIALNVLLPCLSDDEPSLRLAAAQCVYWLLVRVGTPVPRSNGVLLAGSWVSEPELAQWCTALTDALNDEDDTVRAWTCSSLSLLVGSLAHLTDWSWPIPSFSASTSVSALHTLHSILNASLPSPYASAHDGATWSPELALAGMPEAEAKAVLCAMRGVGLADAEVAANTEAATVDNGASGGGAHVEVIDDAEDSATVNTASSVSTAIWDAEGIVCARIARPVAVCVRDGGVAGSAAWETAATLVRARTSPVLAAWRHEERGRGRVGAGLESLIEWAQCTLTNNHNSIDNSNNNNMSLSQ